MAAYTRKRRRLRPQFVLFCILMTLVLINGFLLVRRAVVRAAEAKEQAQDDWLKEWLAGEKLPGEDRVLPAYVEADLLPKNRYSRPGTELKEINAVVIHYVGNPNTTAQANRNYFASLKSGDEGIYASAHFVVGLEGEVLQCIPLTEIAHASNDRNDDTVSIEVCHPDETGEFSPVTYDAVVELTAWLCREFALDPQTQVIRHYDVTEKLCPLYYVEHSEAWDMLRQAVEERLEELAAEKSGEP